MAFERATRRGRSAAALLVATLAATSAARAASAEDRAAAKRHLSQAEELKGSGRLVEACQHLEQVERLDPKLPTLIELAECHEQTGKLVEAQAAWATARDRAKHDEKPQSRTRAEQRLAAVEKRIAHLTLQLAATAAGAQVLRDDAPLESASLASALVMNPGDHVIVVKVAGHDDAKYAVKLADGDNQTLAIAAGPATGSQPTVASPTASLPLASSTPSVVVDSAKPVAPVATGWWSRERTFGVIAGSVGVVAIGGGSALCVLASHAQPGFNVDSRTALGGLSLATGSVLLISGLALLASAPSDEPTPHARNRISPTLLIGRNASVLGAAGEF